MENDIQQKQTRILAIALSGMGFGFAVLEGKEMLVNWGVKQVQGDKNARSLARLNELIADYQPGVIVLEDTSVESSRRALRIKRLSKRIIAQALSNKIKVELLSREEVMKVFIPEGKGTRHALAEIIAQRFPQELANRLPPKRIFYKSEDSRVEIFVAVALALAFRKAPRK